jgi:hypothetical protein
MSSAASVEDGTLLTEALIVALSARTRAASTSPVISENRHHAASVFEPDCDSQERTHIHDLASPTAVGRFTDRFDER